MNGEIDPRTSKSCSDPLSLDPSGIQESFKASATVVMFSPAFHAAIGRSITVAVDAQLHDPGNPALATVGFTVRQCCDISDSDITNQVVGPVGDSGSPMHTESSVTLSDQCTLATHFGSDCIYYIRFKIASSAQAVNLSYSVT
ncbi:hypothetical protein [Kitasatospora sp. HPMI-4]|uniref:hypothetical protein n=1 Tax=Kitasatospora sp. HPMI-4 TaxID=3448443 RepID=UPI003F1B1C96